MRTQNTIVITLILFQNVEGATRIDPLVDTKVGLIRGMRSNNGEYSMFMGIPYGLVNKTNPFGDAASYPKFEDPFEAYDDSSICPQVYQFNGTILGSLDCLHLNVYVPLSATSENHLAVLVWIYGGSYHRGFGGRLMFDPGYLIKHDVILVTINYRVGPYGFMCLDIPEIPGNQGLKDQLLALRWIKENIHAFGGDVNQITLFGESAGGHSIELHLTSSKEKLYNKVIMQSGSAVASTVLIDPDKAAPMKLAEHLGFSTSDLHKAVAFLVSSDTNMVIAASTELKIQFKPCVETEFDGVDAFITYGWINAKVPKVTNMPVLIGFNENEQMVNHENKNAEHFANLDIFTSYLRQTFNFVDEQLSEMKDIIYHFYLGDEAISEEAKTEVINFDSDFTYIHPIQRTIQKFIENGAINIFYYMFSYSGGRNFSKRYNNITATNAGVAHADEQGYLFDMILFPEEPTPEDQLLIDRMTTMWTNFAKYGDPTPKTTELLPVKWTPLSKDNYYYLKIDSELSVGSRPFNERMAFWDLLYKFNRKFQKGYEEA